MKTAFFATAAAILVAGCNPTNYPTMAAKDLGSQKISLLFEFPEGSTCAVDTAAGRLTQTQMPGKIDFSLSDRNAPAECTLPSGQTVVVTAHTFTPDTARVSGITVYPDGRAFITASTSDGLVQLQPTGTVRPR